MTKLRSISVWMVAAAAGVAWACAGAGPAAPTAEEARKFIDDANETMLRVSVAEGQTGWVAQTYITDDTEAINARANQAFSDDDREARQGRRRASTSWICRPSFAAS